MAPVRPVRIGILSTAKIAREKVIPGFRTTSWLEVAALASRDEAKAAEVASTLGIPASYGSYEALLADPTIEAVYIPTPNDSHVDLSLQAAAAGKHVLCEKPGGMTAKDAERLLSLPDGILYLEAFMVRFHPQWIAVRDLVRTGRIGTPVGVQAWFSYANADPGNIRNKPETGGGAALDIGCYPIVVSRFVLDAEPTRLVSLVDRDPTFGTDRLTSALLDFGDGRHLTFTVGTQCTPHQRVTVVGTLGRVEVLIPFNAPQGEETVLKFYNGNKLGEDGAEQIVLPPADQYGLQGEAFAKAIRGEAVLPYGPADTVQMMRILDAVFASDTACGWVDLTAP